MFSYFYIYVYIHIAYSGAAMHLSAAATASADTSGVVDISQVHLDLHTSLHVFCKQMCNDMYYKYKICAYTYMHMCVYLFFHICVNKYFYSCPLRCGYCASSEIVCFLKYGIFNSTKQRPQEGKVTEEKRKKRKKQKLFLVLNPRPGPDGPNASYWYRRLRERISPLSLLIGDHP